MPVVWKTLPILQGALPGPLNHAVGEGTVSVSMAFSKEAMQSRRSRLLIAIASGSLFHFQYASGRRCPRDGCAIHIAAAQLKYMDSETKFVGPRQVFAR